MQVLITHIVPKDISPIRIYDYCNGLFKEIPSRKGVKKAIERGEIKLNGQSTETGFWLKGGETIQLVDLELTPPKAYKLQLHVVFEDEHMAAIIKPAGLLTSGNTFKTVTNALRSNITNSNQPDALPWPLPVHRLDKATSGLLLIAKTKSARMSLGQQFEEKTIKKTYHAVVLGELKGEGIIEHKIEGKEACTYYQSEAIARSLKSKHLTLVKLQPETGRTHQLRIHLSRIGHAILGDPLYSPESLKLKHKGLFLCATQISFKHPFSRADKTLSINLPEKFKKRMESEENRWIKANLS